MKLQWSIQLSHTQLILGQVVYLNYRNEHIWPPTKWLHNLEAFHLASIQIIIFDLFEQYISFLRSVLEIFDISTLWFSLWLFEHYTFQYKMSLFLFWIIHLFLRSVLEIFDISTLWFSLWLFEHHTFQFNKSLSLFSSQILVCATDFCSS